MLSDQEFNDWCAGVNLPLAGRQVIEQIRSTEPIRRVKSSGINVKGDYASRKMGKTIQFESHKVELPGVEEYEEDPDVLEYYDQLYQITLEWSDKQGQTCSSSGLQPPLKSEAEPALIAFPGSAWERGKRRESVIHMMVDL